MHSVLQRESEERIYDLCARELAEWCTDCRRHIGRGVSTYLSETET
jgi:hypothetical protein